MSLSSPQTQGSFRDRQLTKAGLVRITAGIIRDTKRFLEILTGKTPAGKIYFGPKSICILYPMTPRMHDTQDECTFLTLTVLLQH